MSKQNGGIIGPDNVTTGGFSGVASGVFKLGEVTKLIRENKWPEPSPFTNTVPNSCRFNNASSDNLSLSGSSGGSTTKFTRSFWIKRSTITVQQYLMDNSGETQIFFKLNADDTFSLGIYASSAYSTQLIATRKLRDTSAWYHFVIAIDYTNSTQAYRARIYVNGVEITSFSTETRPGNTSTTFNTFNSSKTHYISSNGGGNHFLGGYLAEVVHIDGQQLTPSSFGETNSASGIWVPKAITGLTFGTKGFHLDFKNSSALGNDVSGNNLDYTANNLTSLDQSTDSPSNNFATLNPLDSLRTSDGVRTPIFSDGNTTMASSSNNSRQTFGTFGVQTGKFYWETKITVANSTGHRVGVFFGNNKYDGSNPYYYGVNAFYIHQNGQIYYNGSSITYMASYTAGDIISVALDRTNGQIYLSKNGGASDSTWANGSGANNSTFANAVSISTKLSVTMPSDTTEPFFDIYGTGNTMSVNFGNPSFAISSGNTDGSGFGNFEYSVPTGYLSLCTNNLNL